MMKYVTFGLLIFSPLVSLVARAASDADFVKTRLMDDGYQVKELDLESDWKPGHQFSRIFAPIGDLAQNVINPEIVTMKYYDVHFNTRQGFRYDCVAAIGNNGQLKDGTKYVEIKDCSVGTDDEGSFLKPQLVQIKN